METIGKRIERLRIAKGWKRPELGRRMAAAVNRPEPFSGELVRLYEANKHRPPQDARKALSIVFKKSEQYIEFGESAHAGEATLPTAELGPDERALLDHYRLAAPVWKLTIRLIAGATPNLQPELSHDVNMIMARLVGGPVKLVSGKRMRGILRTSKEGFPPRARESEQKP